MENIRKYAKKLEKAYASSPPYTQSHSSTLYPHHMPLTPASPVATSIAGDARLSFSEHA